MRIAVLVKQVPRFEAMELQPNGRLRREGLDLELNPYCRRAVAKGVELAAEHGGTCTVLTLGPPSAEDTLREAVAWGADAGVLITDPAFAGSDTLATARALATALEREGPWDLVLTGRNSVDADTGQVGPEVAELLDLPMLAGVRSLTVGDGTVEAVCEYDDGFVRASSTLPALLTCAERLCEPAKVVPEERASVDPSVIRVLSADDLGPGPWGEDGSPTAVGRIEVLEVTRQRRVLTGTAAELAAAAVAGLLEHEADVGQRAWSEPLASLPPLRPAAGPVVAVLVEPDRLHTATELLGAAAAVATELGGYVVAVSFDMLASATLSALGADALVLIEGALVEEDAAAAVAAWSEESRPSVILAPGTMWGREVSSRVAARLGAGLTGDAVGLAVERGRLVGWKPAFGGALVAAITATSPVQMATVRPGILGRPAERGAAPIPTAARTTGARGRVRQVEAWRDDEVGVLTAAEVVVGVGAGVAPDEYPLLEPLLDLLGAELGATRKVTDKGWLPRARQIGLTGHGIAPRLYMPIGVSGKFNHMIGVRGAGYVIAINADADAPVFRGSDLGLVGDWHDVVPALVAELRWSPRLAVDAGG
jgi:electron transfer flavoprotein alpha subunit